jgi:hypothetical protein
MQLKKKAAVTTKDVTPLVFECTMHIVRFPNAWCDDIAAAVQEMMDEATQFAHSNTAEF